MKVRLVEILKEAGREFSEDRVPRLASSLAYYTLFSIAPLLLIAIGIAGIVFGEEAARGEIVASLGSIIGPKGAEMLQTMVQSAAKERAGIVATIAGFVTLLFGASGVFGQLHDAFNTIWEAEPEKGGGIAGFIKQRFLSFAMVLGVGFLLLVSLILSAALSAAGKYFGNLLPGGEALWHVVNAVVAFGVITVLFAMMFRLLPDTRIPYRDAFAGGAFTSLLFTLGKTGLSFWLGKNDVGAAYGAAGSLVLLLVWIYYSGLILFLGAEVTEVYSRRRSGGGTRAEKREHKRAATEFPAARRKEFPPSFTPRPVPRAGKRGSGIGKAVAAGIAGLIAGSIVSAIGVVKLIRKVAGI